ncbi:hypothetical protein ABEW34_03210 [Paenibacillus algorifonticola]
MAKNKNNKAAQSNQKLNTEFAEEFGQNNETSNAAAKSIQKKQK